jgi:hypothetical protein
MMTKSGFELELTQAQPLRRSRCAILVERRTTRPSCNLVSSKLSGALSGFSLADRRTLLPSGNVIKNDAVSTGMHDRVVAKDRYVARRTNPLFTRETTGIETEEGLDATAKAGVRISDVQEMHDNTDGDGS